MVDSLQHEADWSELLSKQLESEYGISSEITGNYVKRMEIDLPASRHSLEVSLSSVYGFIITLYIADETGGVLVEKDLYTAVKQDDLYDTIYNVYVSYGD